MTFDILKLVSFCQLHRQFAKCRNAGQLKMAMNIQRRDRLFITEEQSLKVQSYKVTVHFYCY